jgi:hypothetical protein
VTHHSKAGNLSSADIDILWEKVSEKQKEKLMAEYKNIQNDYKQKFENFVRVNSSTLIINYFYVIDFLFFY